MALVTTIASATADSYVTVAEADTYLSTRDPFTSSSEYTTWQALTTAQKEFRLRLGAILIDSLKLRGIRCTQTQARAFPRFMPQSPIYPVDDNDDASDHWEHRLEDWDDVLERAEYLGETAPTIPQAVKDAQVEVAFQVVHGHIATLDPMEEGELKSSSFSVEGLSISVGGSYQLRNAEQADLFSKTYLSAQAVIKLYLKPYLTSGFRGTQI